jgi:hypothetical protein
VVPICWRSCLVEEGDHLVGDGAVVVQGKKLRLLSSQFDDRIGAMTADIGLISKNERRALIAVIAARIAALSPVPFLRIAI